MIVSRVRVASLLLAVLALSACGGQPSFVVAKEEPWRDDDERACLASGLVRESPFVTSRSALGGPSVCGALKPFAMSAAARGTVAMKPPALLRCPMVPAVDYWIEHVVKPAARRHLGSELVEIKVGGSYSCRPINHVDGGRLSEHGHANAIDVSAFVLANGDQVAVKTGWWGGFAQRNFLRAIHTGGCSIFMTVLGPQFDSNHRDHLHLDLGRHGRDGQQRFCK